MQLNIEKSADLLGLLNDQFAVLNAAPFHLTLRIAEAARAARAHYLDLTEDVASTRRVKELAADADTAFIPQCGLAPGLHLDRRLRPRETLRHARQRAAARRRAAAVSVERAQLQPDLEHRRRHQRILRALRGHRRTASCARSPPLEEREEFSLDGVTYEAFNTSGGLGTLCETLEGKVRNLNYRTIRYPGHGAIMKALLNDLRLRDRREVLKDILENAVPATLQDVVIVFVTVTGSKDGRLCRRPTPTRSTPQT